MWVSLRWIQEGGWGGERGAARTAGRGDRGGRGEVGGEGGGAARRLAGGGGAGGGGARSVGLLGRGVRRGGLPSRATPSLFVVDLFRVVLSRAARVLVLALWNLERLLLIN